MDVTNAQKLNKEDSLLQFIIPSQERCRVLLVESPEYLTYVRELLPQAEIHCVVSDLQDVPLDSYAKVDVQWTELNYLQERLTFAQKYFDIILGENLLAQAGNPQDILTGLGLYLKDTGSLITSFINVRYWQVMVDLLQGHFYHVCSHVFAASEMEKLLCASFYKDVSYAKRKGRPVPQELAQKIQALGFNDDNDDLETEMWLMQAIKSMPSIGELKRLYTPEIRRNLVTYLRRLEYGIDTQESLARFWQLYQENQMFPAYVAGFIKETICHINDFLWHFCQAVEVGTVSSENLVQEKFWQELLAELQKIYTIEEGRELLANGEVEENEAVAIAKWCQGNPPEAYKYPAEAVQSCSATVAEALGKNAASDRKIAFITCVNNQQQYAEAVLYIKHLLLPEDMQAEIIAIENAASMCNGYNQAMSMTDAKYKVYLHQDVLIVNKYFIYEILRLFQEKTIGGIGVIGARCLPASGIWWDGMRTYGKVLHACEAESTVLSSCMETEEAYIEAEAVDGLIMATQVDCPWREDLFTGWHFYEISKCKELQRLGYKVVVPKQQRFWAIHMPKEKPLDQSYSEYQRIFLQEYGNELHPEI